MITKQQLKAVCPNIIPARLDDLAAAITTVCTRYGITKQMLPEFLANVAHESGEFSIISESLHYTTPARIVAVWPSRFNLTGKDGKLNANNYIRNAPLLANTVYNGRMGNRVGSNDGYNFRGGGYAQITGRDAYKQYADFVNKRDGSLLTIEDIAFKVQTMPTWAMDSAAWFFCEFKNLEQLAVEDKFQEIVKRWNGGFIGLADRKKYYDRAKKLI